MQGIQNKLICAWALLFLAGLTGCTRTRQAQPATVAPGPMTKTAPATPIEKKKEELGGVTWNVDWDKIIERALSPALLSSRVPRDVRTFCPRFYKLSEVDKRTFWAYVFQALAGAEAGLDPSTNVRHTEPEVAKVDSVSGEMIRSEGLLQLTYEDQKRYGCDFDWNADKELSAKDPAKTILRPRNNLLCGVKILTRQIIRQHKPLLSPSGYWSTLHPGNPDFLIFAKQMTNVPTACGRPPASATAALDNPSQTGPESLRAEP